MKDFDFFAQSLAVICEHSLVAPGRLLDCTIIANPIAGGFSIRSKWKSHAKVLNEYAAYADVKSPRGMQKSVDLILTDGKGAAGEITSSIIEKAAKETEPFYLIISAGGDGTHSEVMFALYNAPAHVRANIAVLRLPFGTGNDGADNPKLKGALDLLINPVHIEFAPAVQLMTASGGQASAGGPYLAFNILSVGLDAYVTHMTNKMKGKMPGDSYKLWLDVAALFYDSVYKVDYFDVRALDEQNNEVISFREKMLLLAMGASGFRTYGSQTKILPDERNVCGLKQMPVHRKLINKIAAIKGTHINNPEAIMLNANRLEITGGQPILAQMDGETILLKPEDFPIIMELTAPVIPLLKM